MSFMDVIGAWRGADDELLPYKKLVVAVMDISLTEAIQEPKIFNHGRWNPSEALRQAANDWIWSPSCAHWSFVWCCYTLDFEPNYVRKRLLESPQYIFDTLHPGAAKHRIKRSEANGQITDQ